jgi:hypothetical protein
MASIEELIAQGEARGLSLLNLFKLEDGRWQANWTDYQQVWEFARGASPGAALSAALAETLKPGEKMARDEPSRGLVGTTTKSAEELGL